MSRLIDADALTAKWEKLKTEIKGNPLIEYADDAWEDIFDAFIADADNEPTIDAVEVVRCKDCKYYLNSNEKCGLVDTRLRFYETDKVWTEDSFCSWGERREDETD